METKFTQAELDAARESIYRQIHQSGPGFMERGARAVGYGVAGAVFIVPVALVAVFGALVFLLGLPLAAWESWRTR